MLNEQMFAFIISLICGVVLAVFYDIFRARRRAFSNRGLIIGLEDFLFWVIAAIAIFLTVMYANKGLARGFMFLGIATGAMLYGLFFSRTVMKIFLTLLSVLKTTVSFIVKILWQPLKWVLKLLSKPVLYLLQWLAKLTKCAGSKIGLAMVKTMQFRSIKKWFIKRKSNKKRKRLQNG